MELAPCPDRIAVIGGGRWARVLSEVVCGLVPSSVEISVHSLHNAEAMSSWVSAQGLGHRVHVSPQWPKLLSVKSSAVIVANAARDHEWAVESAFNDRVPVLVEKPITLTAAASQRLANVARGRKVRFAAAHVFLFARYLDNFSRLVSEAGTIRSLRVRWMDPRIENRYGERKQYDPSLPVFADWLPHVLSMVGSLVPGLPQMCVGLDFRRGGAHLELELRLGDIPCSVQLVRNGDRRERIILVDAGRKTLQLDFSIEPGTITSGSSTVVGDPDWETKRRPAARMLTAFLQWAAGGEGDGRLNIDVGLQASQVIDQTLRMYRVAQMPWLVARLSSLTLVDEDLRYALSEMLQSERPLTASALEQQIERLQELLASKSGAPWLKALAQVQDPAILCKAIAG